MKNYIRYITLLLIFVFWLFPCKAEEVTIYQMEEQMSVVLEEMDIVLQKLSEKYDEFKPEEPLGKDLWSSLEKSKDNIKLILSYSSKISYSPLFLRTLEYDIEAFIRFVQFTSTGRIPLSSSPEVSDVLNASLDLELKSRLIKTSHTDRVTVTVNTINKEGEEVHHCIVCYAPLLLKDDERYKIRFDRLSTPTTDLIPAGVWAIWTEKDGELGQKDTFHCGDDGQSEREIDLFSPK